jgi:hypothetical protein
VIRWHRQGFKYYWAWKSRRKGGRPAVAREVRDLIRRMSSANPLWGAVPTKNLVRPLDSGTYVSRSIVPTENFVHP